MTNEMLQLFALVLGSATFSVGLLWVIAHSTAIYPAQKSHPPADAQEKPVLLFKGRVLVDATRLGWHTFRQTPAEKDDLARFIRLLLPQFPSIQGFLSHLKSGHEAQLVSEDGNSFLLAQTWEDMTRISLSAGEDSEKPQIDHVSLRALEDEVHHMRAIAEGAPFLIWQTDSEGEISWANSAYLELARRAGNEDDIQSWPPRALFHEATSARLAGGDLTAENSKTRCSVTARDQQSNEARDHWFDVLSIAQKDHTIHFATDADDSVHAGRAQKTFVQTLTKTFAQLSVGLAIFDKQRKLSLFNPALLDMFPLPFEFLSKTPTLMEFLDRLREDRILPEPKDYKSWRGHIADLENSAKSGSYCENWTLPGGVVYRIIGRPHPDGAIAFLFEDISAEMLLTRRFRSEIELGRSVIDTLDEAIAVFRSDGVLVMANDGYGRLWGHANEVGLLEENIVDVSSRWQKMCEPTTLWEDVCDFVRYSTTPETWAREVIALDGRVLSCRVSMLKSGDTVVIFTDTNADQPTLAPPRPVTKSQEAQPQPCG